MKKLFLLFLLVTHFAFAQQEAVDITKLTRRQSEKSPAKETLKSQTAKPVASSDKPCTLADNERKLSLARVHLQKLFQDEKNGEFFVENNGTEISLNSSPIAINCREMMEIQLNPPTDDSKFYSFEAKISKPVDAVMVATVEECEGKEKCCYRAEEKDVPICGYKYYKKENGDIKEGYEFFAANAAGFSRCLEHSGVIDRTSGSMIEDNMYFESIGPKVFKPAEVVTSDVMWKSDRLLIGGVNSLYSTDVQYDGCYAYEKMEITPIEIISKSDLNERSRRKQLEDEFQKLCEQKEFDKIYNQHKKYDAVLGDVKKIVNQVIESDYKEYAQSASSRSREGKSLKELNSDKIKDFREYVIDPLIEEMVELADTIYELKEGETDKKTKKTREELVSELAGLENKLKSYSKAPYLTIADRNKFAEQKAYDAAYDLTTVLNRIDKFNAKELISDGSDEIWQDVKKDNQKYAGIVEEVQNSEDRKAGLRPHDAEMAEENAAYELQLLKSIEADYQSSFKMAMMQIQRECPYMSTVKPDQAETMMSRYGYCPAYDQAAMLAEEMKEALAEQSKVVKEWQEKAKQYRAEHNAATKKDGLKGDSKSRLEQYRSRLERYSSDSSSNYNLDTRYNYNMTSNPNLNMWSNNNYFNGSSPFMNNSNYHNGYNGNFSSPFYQSSPYQQMMNPSMGFNLNWGAGSMNRMPAYYNNQNAMGSYNLWNS
ncbi:MAG: hypothetical protein JNM93_03160 [Bacteriovoracaceae bacterium]|nr:hypothetical protein [Bacteriovoracaceae bacterium]